MTKYVLAFAAGVLMSPVFQDLYRMLATLYAYGH